jgi:hypothetical protein
LLVEYPKRLGIFAGPFLWSNGLMSNVFKEFREFRELREFREFREFRE